MEPYVCPGMSKGLCFMSTFMTISVLCYMNNLRKMIFCLPLDLLLNNETCVAAFFFFFVTERVFTPDYFYVRIVQRSDGFRRGKSLLHQHSVCKQSD